VENSCEERLGEYLEAPIAIDIDEERGRSPLVDPILVRVGDRFEHLRKPV
jgi:hypothetical protein